MNSASGPRPKIHGTAVVKDKDGNLKGTFTFTGEVPLSREELEAKGFQVQEVKDNERNPSDEGPKRSV